MSSPDRPTTPFEALLATLAPAAAHVALVTEDVPVDALHPDEQACVSRAVEKRRREFAMGRHAAHRLLGLLGRDEGPILPGPDRAPAWPGGVVGSISHGAGVAAAMVALETDHRGVGLDLEADTPLETGLWPRICTDDERAMLDALDPNDAGRHGKVVFSAKESVFKAVYPASGVYLYFHDCRIALAPDASGAPTRGTFEAHLSRAELPDALRAAPLRGEYAIRDGVIVTTLAWPRTVTRSG